MDTGSCECNFLEVILSWYISENAKNSATLCLMIAPGKLFIVGIVDPSEQSELESTLLFLCLQITSIVAVLCCIVISLTHFHTTGGTVSYLSRVGTGLGT
mmetsp:Transcript_26222/g.49848  ORF Transcript_26222/g.49848 Transcript_26222/m.49848 type:complete len:100 (+) Transcript_26222:451-750(+)